MLALTVHPAEIADADLDRISREDIVKTLRHIQANEQAAIARATAAEEANGKTIAALQQTARQVVELQTALTKIDSSAKAVENERNQAVAYGTQEHEGRMAEKVARAKAEKRALLASVIAGLALLACAALAYLLFKP
jgi:limonene-1,2-epoxide hydrolase